MKRVGLLAGLVLAVFAAQPVAAGGPEFALTISDTNATVVFVVTQGQAIDVVVHAFAGDYRGCRFSWSISNRRHAAHWDIYHVRRGQQAQLGVRWDRPGTYHFHVWTTCKSLAAASFLS